MEQCGYEYENSEQAHAIGVEHTREKAPRRRPNYKGGDLKDKSYDRAAHHDMSLKPNHGISAELYQFRKNGELEILSFLRLLKSVLYYVVYFRLQC